MKSSVIIYYLSQLFIQSILKFCQNMQQYRGKKWNKFVLYYNKQNTHSTDFLLDFMAPGVVLLSGAKAEPFFPDDFPSNKIYDRRAYIILPGMCSRPACLRSRPRPVSRDHGCSTTVHFYWPTTYTPYPGKKEASGFSTISLAFPDRFS